MDFCTQAWLDDIRVQDALVAENTGTDGQRIKVVTQRAVDANVLGDRDPETGEPMPKDKTAEQVEQLTTPNNPVCTANSRPVPAADDRKDGDK